MLINWPNKYTTHTVTHNIQGGAEVTGQFVKG